MLQKLICVLCLFLCLPLCMMACSDSIEYPSNQSTQYQAEDPTSIFTPYLHIVLPEEFRTNLRCEISHEPDAYTLFFYGCVDGKEEMHLFDLVFGRSDYYLLGTLLVNGKELGVYVESYDLDIDETWTEEQRYDILRMQNLINTIIEQLITMGEFTISA